MSDCASVMWSRFVSLMSVLLTISVVSCGGSVATSAPSATSTQGSWQVILTVKAATGLFGITGVALDRQGNLYLAEFDDDRIYKYSTSGKLLAQWGEHGSGPGQLWSPDKLAFDAQGNLYVTEVGSQSSAGNSRIQKFSPTGMPLAQWGTFGSAPGQFNTPVGIAVDQQGDIYVADVGNHRIQKLSSLGQPLTQWHTVGSGTGESTEIGYDLALDASGNVYVSEPHPFSDGNDRIQKFSPAGEPLATWGGSGSGEGQFSQPTGLAVDGKGNVFVVDSHNSRIEELSSTGRYVAQWAAPAAGFKFVSKVALDDHGNIYVSIGSQILKLVVR
jgi:tripartite motif-containing protein 71